MIYQPIPDGKVCRACGQWKSLCEYHRLSDGAMGRRTACKICTTIERGQKRRVPRKEGEAVKCSKCGKEFPWGTECFRQNRGGAAQPCRKCHNKLTKQDYEANREKRLTQRKKRRATNWEEICEMEREQERKRRADDPEKYRQKSCRYYHQHPDKAHQAEKRWREKHPERSRERYRNNPNRERERVRRYRTRHPEQHRLNQQRRRARKRCLLVNWTSTDWQRCLDYWHGSCVYCKEQGAQITGDHFIPLNDPRCLGTIPTNMIPACYSCNSSKNDTDPGEWLTRKFGSDQAQEILARIEVYFEWVREQAE